MMKTNSLSMNCSACQMNDDFNRTSLLKKTPVSCCVKNSGIEKNKTDFITSFEKFKVIFDYTLLINSDIIPANIIQHTQSYYFSFESPPVSESENSLFILNSSLLI